MDSARIMLALAVLAAVFGGAAIWDSCSDAGSVTTYDPDTLRLVPGCDVERVVWEHPSTGIEPVVLERMPGGMVQVQSGAASWPADPDIARDVFDTLDFLRAYRRLPADRSARGLDPPRLTLALTCVGGELIRLGLGDRIDAIEQVWITRLGPAQAHGVGTDALISAHAARALDRSLEALRMRRVFAALASARPVLSAGATLDLRTESEHVRLSGQPAMLHFDQFGPAVRAQADVGAVSELLVRLSELSIVRFTDAESQAQTTDAPTLKVNLRQPSRNQLTAGGDGGVELIAYGPCVLAQSGSDGSGSDGAGPDGPGSDGPGSDGSVAAGPSSLRLAVTSIGSGCIDADALAGVAALVDGDERARSPLLSRLLIEPGVRVREIHIAPAAEAIPAFALIARGGTWRVRDDTGGPGGSDATDVLGATDVPDDQPAAPEAVRTWLRELADATSGAYVAADASGINPAPVVAITVHPSEGAPERIRIFATTGTNVASWRAQRGDEPIHLLLDRAPYARAALSVALPTTARAGASGTQPAPGALRFRGRGLLELEPYGLRALVARSGARVVEHLQRGELLDDWRVLAPARAVVRPELISSLRHAIARLRARAFIAAAPVSGHALTPPRRRVVAEFDPGPLDVDAAPLRHTIDLGAETEVGCVARLDQGGPVFELERATCAALAGPWTISQAPR